MADTNVNIKISAEDKASNEFKKISKEADKLSKNLHSVSSAGDKMSSTIGSAIKTVGTYTIAIGAAATAAGTAAFFIGKNFVEAAAEADKSLLVLGITAEKFGEDANKAKAQAEKLGKELRIGVGPAAESLQNLMKSGLSIDQASDLLKRFTNEALTGKRAGMDLGEAVNNLAFGFMSGNSAITNMSGITENWSDITEKGLKILQERGKYIGKSVGQLDDAALMEARYAGTIELTNLTMGSAEKLSGTYTDKVAELNLKKQELVRTIGTALLPIYTKLVDAGMQAIEIFSGMFDVLKSGNDDLDDFMNATGLSEGVASILLNTVLKLRDRLKDLKIWWEENKDAIKAAIQEGLLQAKDVLEKLQPVFEKFVDVVITMIKWMWENRDTIIWFVGILGIMLGILKGYAIISTIIAAFNPWIPVLIGIAIVISLLITHWEELKNIFLTAMPIILAIGIAIGGWPLIIGAVIGAIIYLIAEWDKIWPAVQGALENIKNLFSTVWTWIKDHFITIMGVILGYLFGWPILVATAIWGVKDKFISLMSDVASVVGEWLITIWNKFTELPGKIWEGISSGADKFGDMMSSAYDKVVEWVKKMIEKIKEVPGEIAKAIPGSGIVGSAFGGIKSGLGKLNPFNTGGVIGDKGVLHFANGGMVPGIGRPNTDSVPAMLTPGEVIGNPRVPGSAERAINALGGGNVTINVNGAGDPQTVAQLVMNALNKQMESAIRTA